MLVDAVKKQYIVAIGSLDCNAISKCFGTATHFKYEG
jgi:hypothetical protein